MACGRRSELLWHRPSPLLGASTPGARRPASRLGEQMASAQLEPSLPSRSSSQRRCCCTSPTFPTGFGCSVGYRAKVYLSHECIYIRLCRLAPAPTPLPAGPGLGRPGRSPSPGGSSVWSSGADAGAVLTPGLGFALRWGWPPPRCLLGLVAGEAWLRAGGQLPAQHWFAAQSPGRAQQSSVCLQLGSRAGPDFAALLLPGCRQSAPGPTWERLGEGGRGCREARLLPRASPLLHQAGAQALQKPPCAAQMTEGGGRKSAPGNCCCSSKGRGWRRTAALREQHFEMPALRLSAQSAL